MASATQAYSYTQPSGLVGTRLGLATSGGVTTKGAAAHPHFFSGLLTEPRAAAVGLLALADVAATRYYQPRPTGLQDRWSPATATGCELSRSRPAAALINTFAETFGTRGPLPALAGRTGSSRLASEATRLQRTLGQQH